MSKGSPWAALYNTWPLIKLTPKGVVFSLLFFSLRALDTRDLASARAFSNFVSAMGLLILHCVCRLTVELEANMSAGPKVAGSPVDDRGPANESQLHVVRFQAGLQAPHVQAQLQVQSQLGMLVSYNTASVLDIQKSTWVTMPPYLCQQK